MERLERLGAKVFIGHEASHADGAHVVVYSSAVARDNVEVQAARLAGRAGDPPRGDARRADAAQVRHRHRGHPRQDHHHLHGGGGAGGGRASIPPWWWAAAFTALGANARLGQGEFLVAEADESDGSFLKLSPTIAVVTTIDAEHLDHYGDLDAIRAAFLAFVNKVPFYGAAVLCLDQPNIQQMIPPVDKRVITYGLESSADLTARRLEFAGTTSRFEVVQRGRVLGAARARRSRAATTCSTPSPRSRWGSTSRCRSTSSPRALAGFRGVQRRFQIRGEARGVLVVDDYGHHPAEIRATLAAAKAGFDRRVITVFQPHRYSRTQHLRQEFLTAFNQSDVLSSWTSTRPARRRSRGCTRATSPRASPPTAIGKCAT